MKEIMKSILKKLSLLILLIIVLIAVNVYFLTYPSKILGKIIDLLYNVNQNKTAILQNIGLLILASIIGLLLRTAWKYFIARSTRILEKDLKDKLFEHFMKIKLSSIQNIKNGELMSYFVKDIREIRGFMYKTLSAGTRMVFIVLIATYTMKQINLNLTVATLCPIFITVAITIVLKQYLESSFKKSQKFFTNLSEYVQESTDAIRTTKAYSGEINQLKKFIKKNKILKKSNILVDLYSTLLSISVSICLGFCYGITIIYGSKLVLNNSITIGDFVAFNGYIDLFYGPIRWIPSIISKFKRAQISYYRLDEVFKLEKEDIELNEIDNTNVIHGDISIKNLTFNYPGNIDCVLDNISIEIKEGERIGIIGTIGSGKTTLMNLLLRLYPIPNGKISINGIEINEIELSKLRNSISYITQDNFLFSTTIRENISLFKDDYNDNEIEYSAEKSMLSTDISNMKNGIYTVIGERGIDLSGRSKTKSCYIKSIFKQK